STLSSMGASGANLTLDVYAPPTLGCGPVASWRWPVGSLPLPSVDAVAIGHGAGALADAAYLGTSAARVHQILAGGVAGWSRQVPAGVTALAASGALVVAGDASGNVTALAAATGDVAWQARLGAGSVRMLRVNGSAGWVLVAGGAGAQRFDITTGAARSPLFSDAGALLQAEDAADGGAFVQSADALVRLDAGFSRVGSLAAHGAGFALAPVGILTSDSSFAASTALRVDPETFAVTPIEVGPPVEVAGEGDADGD